MIVYNNVPIINQPPTVILSTGYTGKMIIIMVYKIHAATLSITAIAKGITGMAHVLSNARPTITTVLLKMRYIRVSPQVYSASYWYWRIARSFIIHTNQHSITERG